jgi:hypothetical protein
MSTSRPWQEERLDLDTVQPEGRMGNTLLLVCRPARHARGMVGGTKASSRRPGAKRQAGSRRCRCARACASIERSGLVERQRLREYRRRPPYDR